MTNPVVGLIGLGNMGAHFAANLARAGFELVLADRDPVIAARCAAHGRIAKTPSDFGDVDILITMLPNGDVVREALIGDNGVAPHLRVGALVVDMSSADPAVYKDIEAALAEKHIGLIDAPVSGNVSGGEKGTLSIMVGGDDAHIDRAEPVLMTLGQRVFRTGALGAGQVMKALNNLVSAGGLMLAIEALLVGKRMGLDPKQMNDILNVSTGRNNSTERKIEPFVLSGAFNSGFGLGLMAKDLRTAESIAKAAGLAAPLSALCVTLANQAADALPDDADHTEVARWISDRIGEAF